MNKGKKPQKSAKTYSSQEIRRSIRARKRRRKYYFFTAVVLTVTIIVLVAATGNLPQISQPPAEQKGDLIVHVVDDATDNLIGGATIEISGPYTTSIVATDGVYSFQSIPVGTYSISASAAGYNPDSVTATVNAGDTAHTTVRLSHA
ncbi:MAG TPA: carboxypeptidase-like regulatory domain-containing protein [Candidatus Bathyarchaeia archaeon]|nr:carboxypeptidase-like regulatory domain-containing protein [Candidatus Bathyarchaeia archaeon]